MAFGYCTAPSGPPQIQKNDGFAMLIRPYKAEKALWLRVKWLCASMMCWPHRVGVNVCHLTFFIIFRYTFPAETDEGLPL